MLEQPGVEIAAKAYRVVGVFVYMVGAGLILECAAFWIGSAVMLAGIACGIRGALLGRDGQRQSARLPPSLRSAAHPTEGRL